jgi:hypothetical protein
MNRERTFIAVVKTFSDNLSLRGVRRRSDPFANLRDCFASLAMTLENFTVSIGTYF